MAYCTYTELTSLTGATLLQATLEAIIAQADREIDAKLAEQGLTGTAGNAQLKAASLELSIAGLITRYAMDGTRDIDAENTEDSVTAHRARAQEILDAYIWAALSGDYDTMVVRVDGL